jgi:hypothetical protein
MDKKLFEKLQENMIHTVQDLIDALEKVKDKNVPVRAYFDPGEYEQCEKCEISMISCIDDNLDGMRVDLNLFQFGNYED